MAKKNKGNSFTNFWREIGSDLQEETVQTLLSIIFFILGVFFVLSALNLAGVVGRYTFHSLSFLLGIGYFLLPVLMFILGFSFLKFFGQRFSLAKALGSLFFFLSGMGIIHIVVKHKGGVIGNFVATPLLYLFDIYATMIILIALFVISLLVIFDRGFTLQSLFFWKKGLQKKEMAATEAFIKPPEDEVGRRTKPIELVPQNESKKPKEKKEPSDTDFIQSPLMSSSFREFTPLPLSLLEEDRGKPGVGDIKANANIIKRTLQNFGIDVEMDEISIGPSVTRYALKPAEGIKLSRIVALQNDLALALAAHPIRIEAPIPGKSLVGIEIPNTTKTTVGLGTLLASPEYQESHIPLLVSLGKGVSGKSYFANIGKMPHLLIAGATGSGKSVTIHTLITSLLYRNAPDFVKFIMIDPKRVELTLYNKIPHLLTPVITDPKKAILSLKWAAKEMERRYNTLESYSVRDISSYHKNIVEPALKKIKEGVELPEQMPYIVIIIDELADIMSTYPRELEAAIVRLAQMSRAVGIHLVLSTQRPSVNVITGLIKANVPARIALQVASQIDSRTILDSPGAEKLLGAGDMLYMSGDMSKPARIQSAFISETELKRVVKHLVDAYEDEIRNEISLTGEPEKNAIFDPANLDAVSMEDDDELYEQAREEVVRAGKASTSYLQRKLRIGYARAARLIDLLEERGVIGAGEGAKPRSVIDGGPQEETHGEETL